MRGANAVVYRFVLFASLSMAASASAQDVAPSSRVVARSLGYAGVEAFQRGEYTIAADKLDRAFGILQAPSLGLWSARTFEKLGWLVQASERYRMVARLKPSAGEEDVQRAAQQEAAAELEALTVRIPILVVVVEGASAFAVDIKLDGSAFSSGLVGEGCPVNPGPHQLVARRGDDIVRQTVSIAEKERKETVLRFGSVGGTIDSAGSANAVRAIDGAPFAASTDVVRTASVQRTMGWTAAGVGAAALATGVVTGLVALNRRASLSEEGCNLDTNQCPLEQSAAADTYNSLRTVSSVAFIAGSVLGATGVVLLLTLPKSVDVSVSLAPSSAIVAARF
jgi:hypothetical protein